MHSQQFCLRIHRDADFLETSQQPGLDPRIQWNDEVSLLRMTQLHDGAHRRMRALRDHLALAHVQILAQNDHLFMFHTGTHKAASIAMYDSMQARSPALSGFHGPCSMPKMKSRPLSRIFFMTCLKMLT